MKLRHLCLTAAFVTASQTAMAADLDLTGIATKAQFDELSENLGAALSYKAVAPAEPLGVPGFDIGLEVSSTEIADNTVFDAAFGNDAPSTLLLPKLHAHVGLPFGIDVGYFFTSVPSTNIKLQGAEIRYAIIEGGVAMPALAIRGTMSKLSGVDNYDLSTKGLELTVSKGFAMATPYAGIGQVWTDAESDVNATFDDSYSQGKIYVGLNFNMGLMNLAFEGDKTGDYATYSAKLGFRF